MILLGGTLIKRPRVTRELAVWKVSQIPVLKAMLGTIYSVKRITVITNILNFPTKATTEGYL